MQVCRSHDHGGYSRATTYRQPSPITLPASPKPIATAPPKPITTATQPTPPRSVPPVTLSHGDHTQRPLVMATTPSDP